MTRSFIQSLAGKTHAAREAEILAAVRRGDYAPVAWQPVEFVRHGHHVLLAFTTLPLRIGTADDSVIVNVSAKLAESICKELGWGVMTARLADILWEGADVRLSPKTQPYNSADRKRTGYSNRMDDIGAMLRNSRDILDEVDPRSCALVANCGKHWVATKRKVPNRAYNYGWHSKNARYQAQSSWVPKVLQPMASAHTPNHSDYSQVLYGVTSTIEVDGVEMTLGEVARHPVLWKLISSEGVIDYLSLLPVDSKKSVAVPIRNLRYGMQGDDVKQLESFFGLLADGYFDRVLSDTVRGWQRTHGLVADGVVGPSTRARMIKEGAPASTPKGQDDWAEKLDLEMTFIQAKNYRPVSVSTPRDINWVVLHSMEAPEKPTMAEGVANWFAGKSGEAPMASAHFNIDNDSIAQGVHVKDVAFAAPGANRNGIQIEHAGYARQTRDEWLDDYSEAMLWLSARTTAKMCVEYDIPVRYVDREGLRRGDRGITTHNEVTFAWRKTNHRDPGNGFPMDHYLRLVQTAIDILVG